MRSVSKLVKLICIAGLIAWTSGSHAQRNLAVQSAGTPAPAAQKRLALVIGNSAYKTSPLRNPANDARDMARALGETGFQVTVVVDASSTAMRRAIRQFGDAIASGTAVGLFYYAGHGMQVKGRNFLIPVDAEIEREDEVEDQAVDTNLVLSKMESAKNALNIMILDACRNNPFARSFRSSSSGLAQMDAPSGTLIAFATAPGSVAADGDGDNGVYTKHLLRTIRQPGTAIEQVFKQVRIGVMAETKDRQTPWESSSLKGDFSFIPVDTARQAREQKQAQDEAMARVRREGEEKARRESEERAAKDRAALEAKMAKTMEEMLARQRAEFQAELALRQQAPSIQVAAASSSTAGAASPSLLRADAIPRVGDTWQYASGEIGKAASGSARAEVQAVRGGAIMESIASSVSGQSQRVHTEDVEILGFGFDDGFVLSPFLFAFRQVKVGDSWSDIPFKNLNQCSKNSVWRCTFSAKVTGRESIKTQAGEFLALRVEVDQFVNMGFGAPTLRKVVHWYSPEVKRLVRVEWKTLSGNWRAPDRRLDLVSYKLN